MIILLPSSSKDTDSSERILNGQMGSNSHHLPKSLSHLRKWGQGLPTIRLASAMEHILRGDIAAWLTEIQAGYRLTSLVSLNLWCSFVFPGNLPDR